MTDRETMALIGANTKLQTRLVYSFCGLLALFFPGYVSFFFLRAFGDALKRLSVDQREAVNRLIFGLD